MKQQHIPTKSSRISKQFIGCALKWGNRAIREFVGRGLIWIFFGSILIFPEHSVVTIILTFFYERENVEQLASAKTQALRDSMASFVTALRAASVKQKKLSRRVFGFDPKNGPSAYSPTDTSISIKQALSKPEWEQYKTDISLLKATFNDSMDVTTALSLLGSIDASARKMVEIIEKIIARTGTEPPGLIAGSYRSQLASNEHFFPPPQTYSAILDRIDKDNEWKLFKRSSIWSLVFAFSLLGIFLPLYILCIELDERGYSQRLKAHLLDEHIIRIASE